MGSLSGPRVGMSITLCYSSLKVHPRNTSGDLIARTQENIVYMYKDNELSKSE